MIYYSPREASFDNFFRQRLCDECRFFLSNLLIGLSCTLLRSSLNASLFPSSTPSCLSTIFPLIKEELSCTFYWADSIVYSLRRLSFVPLPGVYLHKRSGSALRGHPFMTSTKKSDFWPPFPRPHEPDPFPLMDAQMRSTWNTQRSLETVGTMTFQT